MPHCQFSVFCYFCVSKNLHRKYSQNWTKQKPKFLFSRSVTESKAETGGGLGPAHTMGCRGLAPGRATRWWGHLAHSLTPPFRLYIPLNEKTLNTRSIFHEIYYKASPLSTRDWEGPEALPGTLPERGITAGGLLHHHACLRSDL
jgi:hypothetical protein